MKTVAQKSKSRSQARAALPKVPDSMPNPKGVEMMRQLLGQGTIAAKLTIGSPSDPAEREADRAADAVVNGTGGSISVRENRAAVAPKQGTGFRSPETVPGSTILSGGSRRLNTIEQNYFEQRFNRDFSGIRIHESTAASHAASAINARAFTHGSNVYLKQGEYSFGNTAGKRLMAHELAHTLQPDNGVIRRWNGDEHMAFGNIAGGMVADNYDTYMQALENVSDAKESALHLSDARKKEETDEGTTKMDGKEKKIREGHDGVSTKSITISYVDTSHLERDKKKMLLGKATELSGDHRESAKELAASFDDDKKLTELFMTNHNPSYLGLALTNYNHFFPLAAQEWRVNHGMAIAMAMGANQMFRAASLGSPIRRTSMFAGNLLLEKALQYEAFGLHFLQDAFASGHQYPRAFDTTQPTEFYLFRRTSTGEKPNIEHRMVDDFSKVSRLQKQGWKLTGTGDKSIGHKARIYHDLLCELENGIHLTYRGKSQRFHGDATGDSSDYPVAVETYNSIAQVLCTAFSANMAEVGAQKPEVPEGPCIPEIMKDEDAAPIWYVMEEDLEENNFGKNIGNPYTSQKHRTDSGMVSFTHDSVNEAWEAVHDGRGFVSKEVKDGGYAEPRDADFYRQTIKDPKFLFRNLDDNIVKYLEENTFPSTIPPRQCAYLITLLTDGACGDADEDAVLKILEVQPDNSFFKIVVKVGIPRLDGGIDGEEWTRLLDMIRLRVQGQGAALSNDTAAKLVQGLINTSCGNDEETLVLDILQQQPDDGFFKIVLKAGIPSLDNAIDGGEWTRLLYMIELRLKNKTAPSDTATSLIQGLMETECWDQEEELIIAAILNLDDADCSRLLNDIELETFDEAIDGQEWDEFLGTITSKLKHRENKGADQIAAEKNDDAARLAVSLLWKDDDYGIFSQHLSYNECIGFIKALLSGSCGDDDENAIVKIVEYMTHYGPVDYHKWLINEKIGQDTMDRGVDGAQWDKICQSMGWD